MKALLLACLSFSSSLFLAAAEPLAASPVQDPKVSKLLAMAAERSKAHWQGEYWAEEKFKDGQTAISGRNCHYFTLVYWNLMQFKVNGDKEAQKAALSHFDSMDKRFWDEGKGVFRSDYDFLMNASVSLSLGLALRDAPDSIPPEYAARMKAKLAAIAKYLPTYDSSLKKLTSDLRANNQDAFASMALALSALALNDQAAKDNALLKLRSILAIGQQSFWVEGGVDVGYQQVGEPSFGAAADILWDSLSREERRKVSDLIMVGRAGNGFGVENARSQSWLRSSGAYMSSSILNRIADPFIASDAKKLFMETAEQGFKSKWWLYDPASLAFFSGYLKYKNEIDGIAALSDRFGSGSLACQIMDFDEQGERMAGMEKAFLTGEGASTAIFGDYSRLCPKQALAKFGNDKAPRSWNPGGLRYFGFNRHLYAMADEELGLPRLTSDAKSAVPQLVSRRMLPGPFASQYQLEQAMPGIASKPPVFVEQSFIPLGRSLVAVFRSKSSLEGLSWSMSGPSVEAKIAGSSATLVQQALSDSAKKVRLELKGFKISAPEFNKDPKGAYFKNAMDIEGLKAEMPKLRVLKIPFEAGSIAALVMTPSESDADSLKDLKIALKGAALSIKFSANGKAYSAAMALEPMESLELESPDGGALKIERPEPGYLQSVAMDSVGGALKGLSVRGNALSGSKALSFKAQETLSFSALKLSDGSYLLELDGKASLEGVKEAQDLSAGGAPFKPGSLEPGRYRIK